MAHLYYREVDDECVLYLGDSCEALAEELNIVATCQDCTEDSDATRAFAHTTINSNTNT